MAVKKECKKLFIGQRQHLSRLESSFALSLAVVTVSNWQWNCDASDGALI
jgi:hypothetical protein